MDGFLKVRGFNLSLKRKKKGTFTCLLRIVKKLFYLTSSNDTVARLVPA